MAHIQKRTYRSAVTGKVTVRWQARFTAPDGRERTKRFERKVDAERWLKTNVADLVRHEWFDPDESRVRFKDWAETWKTTLVDLRPSTKVRDLDYLERDLLPTFGDLTLGEIDFIAVQKWVSRLTSKGPIPWWDIAEQPERTSRPLGAATTVKAYLILSKIMAAAVRAGKRKTNPSTGVKLPSVEVKEMRFLTPAQVDTLAQSIDERYKALILVAAYGGLRIGELAGLRRSRVDTLNARVNVAEIVVELEGQLTYGQPKTKAGRRSVTLPASVMKILVDHMERFTPADPDAFVFQAPDGGPIRVPLWRQRFWRPAVITAGLVPLRPHDLRHTAVALWIKTGANPLEVSRRAGHTSASFTQDRYGHLFPEADREVADRLDALILRITSAEKVPEDGAEMKTSSNSDGRMTDEVSESDADVLPFIAPDQGEDGGRCGTRTHDLSRVKAAL